MNIFLNVFAIFCACNVGIASAVLCYECNVWKAGYGHQCDQPRLREDCTVCMKTETVVYMGYYKNTPRKSVILSRICAKSNTVNFSNECHRYDTSDGTSTRCYCDTDRCNGATTNKSLANVFLFVGLGLLHMLYRQL